jgi:hypothetical protein
MSDVYRSQKPRRAKDAHEGSMLSRVLSSATFAEKIEAIREHNPYFYLLTPPLGTDRANDDK